MKKYKFLFPDFAFLIISFVILIDSLNIKKIARSRVSSAVFPQIVGIIMLILSTVLIIRDFIRIKNIEEKEETKPKELIEKQKAQTKTVFVTFCMLITYTLLLTYFGFLLSTALYLFIQIFYLANSEQRKKWYRILIISVVTDLVIYFSFYYGFSLILPSGKIF